MGQQTHAMDIRPVLWSDESKFEIFGSERLVFVRHRVGDQMISACVAPTVKHGGGGVGVLCWWHCLREIKAHLTSVATTAFCCDTSSYLVCGTSHLFFTRTMTQHTSRLYKGYFTKKESDSDRVLHQMTSTITRPQPEVVWDELGRRMKEKQPTSAQHMWELQQDCWKSIPGEAGWENAKSVQSCYQGRRRLLWRISNITHIWICLTLSWLLHVSICVIT